MMPKPPNMPAHIPSYWMPYFQVDNVDASVAKSSSLAGKVMVPAQDIPNTGRFAILTDPQGAMFAVFQRN
jgi:predicted enzyme related to lactoylglutathione lyase